MSTPSTRWAKSNRKVDSGPEVKLRSCLYSAGLRYRKNPAIKYQGGCVRPDIAFPGHKLAVFLDGCFWHDCPVHGSRPRSNSAYWEGKLAHNVERDRAVDRALEEAGWCVLRIWEHQDLAEAVEIVKNSLKARARFVAGAS
jgi:DNA mismatch endonuclease (patch repair protein)